MTAIACLIVLLAYLRYKDVPLDRDWTPYTYPAVFGVPYLRGGHTDIKPPLIHWSFKLWRFSVTPLRSATDTESKPIQPWLLRLLPSTCLMLAVASVGTANKSASLALALTLSLPSMWPHMANTEWLTVFLWSLALALTQAPGGEPLAWAVLGLTPWANQKNALLIAPVAWALGLHVSTTSLIALSGPSVGLLAYLALTGRLTDFWHWCVRVPAEFGKKRTFRLNTLSALHLLKPGLGVLVLLLAVADWRSPWFVVALLAVALAVWSKQVVPHHYIAIAFPLALAAQPGPLWFVALLLYASSRDLLALYKPALIYPLTFPYRDGRSYGDVLKDADEVLDYLAKQPDETIWVNGWENQLYIQSGKRATQVNIPEYTKAPETAPRIIVHCANGSVDFDYSDYETEFMTVGGFYVVMRRNDASR